MLKVVGGGGGGGNSGFFESPASEIDSGGGLFVEMNFMVVF